MTTAFIRRRVRRRVHRYVVTETWGDPPEWLTDLVREPDAFFLSEYRGAGSTWEVADKAGRIVFGFAGDHAGISPVAVTQGVDA